MGELGGLVGRAVHRVDLGDQRVVELVEDAATGLGLSFAPAATLAQARRVARSWGVTQNDLLLALLLQAMALEQAYESRPPTLSPRLQARAPGEKSVPLKDLETALIRRAVEEARGNVAQAAEALGISRATVYRKLAQKQHH